MLRKFLEMPCTWAKDCGAFFIAYLLRVFSEKRLAQSTMFIAHILISHK